MAYIENNLGTGEQIIRKAKIHWFIYFPSALCLFIAILQLSSGSEMAPLGIFFILGALVLFITEFITRRTTELALTNKRVIAKHGLIVRQTIELNLTKVEGLSVDQGIMGRILNFGKVTVNGTGGARTPFKFITEPLELRKAVNEESEKNQ